MYFDPEEGLQVRTKRRKKIVRPRVPIAVPDAVNQRWSMDFVSAQLANGRRFRVLNIVDDFSREYVLKIVDFSISGHRVARELDRISRRLPKTIVCDNVLPTEVKFSKPQRGPKRLITTSMANRLDLDHAASAMMNMKGSRP